MTEPFGLPIQTDPPEPAGDAPDLGAVLVAAAAGDESAWRAIVQAYGRRVFALARSRRLDPERAEEIAQSVFVTVAQHVRTGAYTEKGRFESWLFQIAMNRIRDEGRRAARRGPTVDPSDLGGLRARTPRERTDEQDLAALRTALDALGESDREVVELRHHAGMGFREIAELLAEPLGTILARHHRALRKLKDLLESGPRPPENR